MTIDSYLAGEIRAGSFPSAAYAIGSSDGIEQEGALGHSIAVPLRLPATLDTIYDVASLTKPLITTTLVLQAIAEGRISLDDSFRGYTFRELLTHTSGLRAWLPLYAFDDYLGAIAEHGPENPRGAQVVYSDLNFVLLYFALREVFGDYVAAARSRIFEPLGLRDATFTIPPLLLPRVAATEWGQRWEVGMCSARSIPFNGFRQGLIWGEPHDGNTYHFGGPVGVAGLWTTAREVFRIVQGFLRGELGVPLPLVAEATRNQTPGMADGRGFGWQIGTGSAATSMLSEGSFGHTGFTGTSVWVDKASGRIMVLLTNRVHPCAAPIAMQKIRGEFHKLAMNVGRAL